MLTYIAYFDMTQLAEIQITYCPKKPEPHSRIEVRSSSDCEKYFREIWSDKMDYVEEMYLLLLNRANMILGFTKISMGGVNSTVVDPKVVFQTALKAHASGIILGHNHPSGTLKPSQQDLQLTKRINEGAAILDISLLDHIIISSGGYFSFADDGLI